MAVYTPLSSAQITQLLEHYKLGQLISYNGIADGIENTNYHIKTHSGNYILTLFEHYTAEELSYFLNLLQLLRNLGMAVPEPVADSKQQIVNIWQKKPLAFFHHLPGQSVLEPDTSHCQHIGRALGRLHQVGQHFSLHRSNPWGKDQLQLIGKAQLAYLNRDDALLLSDELLFQNKHFNPHLSQGVIHADLFRDNVLFEHQFNDIQLTGVLDFYSACNAPLLFDLAISVNDWCLDSDNYLDPHKVSALLSAYEQERVLDDNEKQHWSTLLRAAALRFWLSRLSYRQAGKQGSRLQQTNNNSELIPEKDPNVLKCLLIKHRENISFCQSLMYS